MREATRDLSMPLSFRVLPLTPNVEVCGAPRARCRDGHRRSLAARPTPPPSWRSTVSRELFTHDFAHELLRYWLLAQPNLGFERFVDQSLISLSGSFGL